MRPVSIVSKEKREEMGGVMGLQKILLEPKKVKFTYISYFFIWNLIP